MLRLHNEIVGSLRYDDDVYTLDNFTPRTLSGRVVIEHLWGDFAPNERGDIDSAIRCFEGYPQRRLGHYFRNLYRIVLFVDEQAEEDKKMFYMCLIRAQSSIHEAQFLFYHYLCSDGKQTFKPLVEQYALLDGVENLIPDEQPAHFAPSAFGAAE